MIWLPPVSLIAAVLVIPLLSMWLAGPVGDRLAVEVPRALPIIDAWRTAAVAAIVGGLALVLAVPLAVFVGRGRPRLVLWFLRTGARIGIFCVAVLVLVHGLLRRHPARLSEQILLGRAFPATGTLLLLGGLAASVYLASLRDAQQASRAVADHPSRRPGAGRLGIEALVARLADRMAAPAPDRILIGAPFDFWTSEASFDSLDGTVSGRSLCLSLPELALMSEEHLEAILAHELAHLRAGDTVWGVRRAPAVSRLYHAIETHRRVRGGSRGSPPSRASVGSEYASPALFPWHFVVTEDCRRSEAAADPAAAGGCGRRARWPRPWRSSPP